MLYWKDANLKNLSILIRGTSNFIRNQAKRITRQRSCGTYPGNWKKCPMNGANRPDISVLDKKNKEWIIIEGTICNSGKITMSTKHKKDKYIDLKLGIKNLYLGHKVKLITVVFDFLAVYYKDIEEELTSIVDNNLAKTTIERSQKWIISQNCEIVKRFLS